MRKNFGTIAVTAAAVLGLGLTGCAGNNANNGNTSAGSSDAAASVGGSIVLNGCTPEQPLVPGNTSETCGGDMVTAMTSQLVHYDTETSKPEMDIAESIETTDNIHFKVKLKKGYKFHDGTEVKAKNFVDAWNYTAAGKNGQKGSYFFTPFAGYDDIADKDAKGDKLTGLSATDDYNFVFETSAPTSNMLIRLGYSAFSPLPDSFFKDPKAFEKHPVGTGQFAFDKFDQDKNEYVFKKFADYSGKWPAQVDGVVYRVYTDQKTAYADLLGNNLDYINAIPSDSLVGGQYKEEVQGRTLQRETGRFSGVVFSPDDEQLAKNKDLRAAISMAVDRNLINEKILANNVKPAHGYAPSVVDGAKDSACGEKCDFKPEEAKKLYEKAGGYKGTLTLTVNGDGDNKTWATAVCNSIQSTLGTECVVQATANFKEFIKKVDAHELKGLFRTGWQMDYPSIENFLAPIYGKGADSNWSRYDNPKFDELLQKAAAAESLDEANKLYNEAENMLGDDLPTMPLWYPKSTVAWSQNIDNVKINAFGVIDLSQVKKVK